MKINTFITGLLAALILTSCAPTKVIHIQTETVTTTLTSTSTPISPTVTNIPTIVNAENLTPPAYARPLSAKGPWLLYVRNTPRMQVMDVMGTPAEFTIVNQDGSGHISITLPDCREDAVDHFLIDWPNSINYRAHYEGNSYLFRPTEATGMQVDGFGWYKYPTCNTFPNGDEKNELLASIYQAEGNDVPELIIYELPNGKIRDRIPLVKCAKDATACEKNRIGWRNMGEQRPEWSPNGRYLAFSAVLDSASSDLFLYDAKDGNLRRLTNGPDWVGVITWSPDGTQIIMNEIANHDDGYFPRPSIVGDSPKSLWSVSVINNEIKFLYDTNGAYTSQSILQWVGNKRFFTYEGFLGNADQARNLRLVDIDTGTNRILFDGDFVTTSFDPIHQMFTLGAIRTDKYPDGYYLVSA